MGKLMSVYVRKSQIRKSPSFLSQVLGEVVYGDQVTVLEENGGWDLVKWGGNSGFIHSSALTAKTVILNSDRADVQKAASSDEYALAGKGFNRQVESRFRAENPRLNFKAIDRMEGYGVGENQIRTFLNQGKVFPGRGQG